MGKKEKDKSKKYDEIRAIVRDEMELVLQKLAINVQFAFNSQSEETSSDSPEVTDEKTIEEQAAPTTDAPDQEKA